jgi:hypothetical protein
MMVGAFAQVLNAIECNAAVPDISSGFVKSNSRSIDASRKYSYDLLHAFGTDPKRFKSLEGAS